ncbi:MAG: hypothetical protein KAI47_13970 [Deltaproteobacteria bacterium]|nr:hypothetical protein [Deltaproteobacteria bacterium]
MSEERIPFSRQDEARIRSAARWGGIAAVSSVSASLLDLLIKVLSGQGLGLAGIIAGSSVGLTISFILALYLYRASVAFRKVVTTDEADEHYLLEGFEELRRHFKVMGILMTIVTALGGVAIFGGLMCNLLL